MARGSPRLLFAVKRGSSESTRIGDADIAIGYARELLKGLSSSRRAHRGMRGAREGGGGSRGCYILFSVSLPISESVKRRDNR